MNRTLRRPMFRLGGPTSEGITSGLGKTKMASADMDMKIKQLTEAFMVYKQQGGTLSFEDFSRLYAEENFNKGGRVGYQQGTMPNFQFAGMPGFLTSFGLNLLATPPQGNIFQTAAVAAKDPFNVLQAQQTAQASTAAEREFLRREREAGDEAAMDRLKLKLESDQKIAGMKTDDALYNVMLEQYIENDLPPQAAERAALFSTQNADTLRAAVTGQRYGGVLTFDVRDPNVPKKSLKNLDGKVVYDPFEDNYKYIVVKDGEIFFDEFNTIEEIKFPDLTLKQEKEKIQNFESDVFSPRLEDAQP